MMSAAALERRQGCQEPPPFPLRLLDRKGGTSSPRGSDKPFCRLIPEKVLEIKMCISRLYLLSFKFCILGNLENQIAPRGKSPTWQRRRPAHPATSCHREVSRVLVVAQATPWPRCLSLTFHFPLPIFSDPNTPVQEAMGMDGQSPSRQRTMKLSAEVTYDPPSTNCKPRGHQPFGPQPQPDFWVPAAWVSGRLSHVHASC